MRQVTWLLSSVTCHPAVLDLFTLLKIFYTDDCNWQFSIGKYVAFSSDFLIDPADCETFNPGAYSLTKLRESHLQALNFANFRGKQPKSKTGTKNVPFPWSTLSLIYSFLNPLFHFIPCQIKISSLFFPQEEETERLPPRNRKLQNNSLRVRHDAELCLGGVLHWTGSNSVLSSQRCSIYIRHRGLVTRLSFVLTVPWFEY